MNRILKELYKYQDLKYADFSANLTPNLSRNDYIGVRVPNVRKIAKLFYKNNDYLDFIQTLPHDYFEENMAHGLIISEFDDYEKTIDALNIFLPYVNNWAVCDCIKPKAFKKNKNRLIVDIKRWLKSKDTYVLRFAVSMLMTYFLDDDFNEEYLNIVSKVKSDEYYVNMMIAWYYATALAKQYDATIPYIVENKLDKWINNKTIQKAIESYRINDESKIYLKQFKR